MANKLISIITPTFNRAEDFLPKTIKSIQLQREVGFEHEHIIVDNASSDNTQQVVAQLIKDDPRIKYIRNDDNLGPAHALNVGIKQAKGDLVLPLDDDDLLFRNSLQFHFDFMEANNLDWSFGFAINIEENGNILGDQSDRDIKYSADPKKFFDLILESNTITNGTVIFKKSCALEVNGWDENIKSQDWDMWLKLIKAGFAYKLNPSYVLFYRVHHHQLTTTHLADGTYDRDQEYFRKKYQIG